ncbi:MAG: 3-oxoadipate enol-lactonase [Pseudomonadota bacterium]
MAHIDVNGTTLQYQFDGPEQGHVVMLSNSLASDLTMWNPQIPALVRAGFRVLRYDSRGHGGSAVSKGPYSMELLTDDAVALMDALGLDKVHFCGLSMGGMVGQILGSKYEPRLASLTLCSTAAYMGQPGIWDERIAVVQEKGMEAVVDATIDRWFTKAGQRLLSSDVEKIRVMILSTPVEGFCACSAAIRDMDQREAIRSITTPTMILVGEQDPGTPVSAAQFIHERITSSGLQVFKDAAHFLNVERSEAFNDALLNFLTKGAP